MNISILGTRGIPARHGGFETFAEHLSIYLAERGHHVTVYCQSDIKGPMREEIWNGIRLVTLHGRPTPMGTIAFDCAAALHAARRPGLILTLGYNTALLSILYRFSRHRSLMNMDGMEWQRDKWSWTQRLWLRLNERVGAALSDHLVADHPEIGNYLSQFTPPEKIDVIPYESEPITSGDAKLLTAYGLTPGGYAIVIARAEPENSLLEIVEAFSRKPRGMKLLMVGRFFPELNQYHRKVISAGSSEVIFAEAIYDKQIVQTLRFFARIYIHGHRVGGTNPSLVESLAAGNPVVAHDNRFTRWVAGPQQQYFVDANDLSETFDVLLDDKRRLDQMASASRTRHYECFTPERVLPVYERLLVRFAEESICTASGTQVAKR